MLKTPNINVNLQNNIRWTALMYAAAFKSPIVINFLLSRKDIRPNLKDFDGYTAIMLALFTEDKKTVKAFLNFKKVDKTCVNNRGSNLLHCAVQTKNPNMVKLILKQKEVDANSLNNNGQSPLHLAIKIKNINVIQCLLADPKVQIQHKKTKTNLINVAIMANSKDTITCLLHNGTPIPKLLNEFAEGKYGFIQILKPYQEVDKIQKLEELNKLSKPGKKALENILTALSNHLANAQNKKSPLTLKSIRTILQNRIRKDTLDTIHLALGTKDWKKTCINCLEKQGVEKPTELLKTIVKEIKTLIKKDLSFTRKIEFDQNDKTINIEKKVKRKDT